MPYIIQNKNLDKNRVFILQKSELEKRLDPLYYSLNIFGFLKTTNFKTKTIREIAKYTISGFGVGKEEQDLTEKGFIQIRPTNLDEFGSLKFDRNIYLGNEFLDKKNNIIQKGDILFNNTNSQELVGKTAYFDLDGTYFHSNHITRIKVDENIIRPKFLWLLLNFYQKRKIFYTICTNWNNQSGVGIELLNSLKIVVPDFETQDKIIAIYETAFAYKKQSESEANKLLSSIDDYLLSELGITLPAENNITTLVEKQRGFELNKHNSVVKKGRLFLTRFSEIGGGRFDPDYHSLSKYGNLYKSIESSQFGTKKLSEICEMIFQGVSKNETLNNTYTLLKVKNVLINNEICYDDVEFVESVPQSKLLKKNDILSPFIGEAIRQIKFSVFDKEGNYTVDNNTGVIRLKNDINAIFVCEYLCSMIGRIQVSRLIGGGGVPFLGSSGAKNLIINVPPLAKQNTIAEHISNLNYSHYP